MALPLSECGMGGSMSVTVVLTNYLRSANMKPIIDTLLAQRSVPRLFVWDNSPGGTFQDDRADWVIRSSQNAHCTGRWWLAAQADTPWVVVMDDDLVPRDDRVLCDTLACLAKAFPKAIGPSGVILDPDKDYLQCQHVKMNAPPDGCDTPVDIVKGRYFAVARDAVRRLPYLPLDSEDDIIVSACVGGGVVPQLLKGRFRDLPTGEESRRLRERHSATREVTRRQWFPGSEGARAV